MSIDIKCLLFRLLPLLLLLLISCEPTDPDTTDDSLPEVRLVTPPCTLPDGRLPLLLQALSADSTTLLLTGNLELEVNNGGVEPATISVKRGFGSGTLLLSGFGTVELAVSDWCSGRTVEIPETTTTQLHAGELEEALVVWTPQQRQQITADLLVPAGVTLSIDPGTQVLLAEDANLIVQGVLLVNGSEEMPVVFAPVVREQAWGGIEIQGEPASFSHCFFVGGGGDDTRQFGHSRSQPVLKVEQTTTTLSHCYFLDNSGKALGAEQGEITFTNGLISRCDTGGEFIRSVIHLLNLQVQDIPDGDGIIDDDDNDGFYFNNVDNNSPEFSVVDNCCIITTEDDAIDHNAALLEVRNCWLEGALHEGVACSSRNQVRIINTVVKGCGQGIEAGYGNPQVQVDHCVVLDNEVGLRFGDSYEGGSTGRIEVTNSILCFNGDDILNYDPVIQAPVDSGIVISYSLANDSDYDNCIGCITGEPLFDEDYLLLPGSPGEAGAEDDTDMGLVNPLN